MPTIKILNRQTVGQLLLAAAVLLLAEPALAFRCKGKLVMEGDPQIKVLKFCGEPTLIQQRTIYRSGIPRRWISNRTALQSDGAEISVSREELLIHDRSVVEVIVEEWTYNLGPHKLIRVVHFENGRVTEIDRLGYGYTD